MKKRGAFVGLTNMDYVYYLDSFPEENSKCKTLDYARYVGGPAANAAISYAVLGGDATLFSAYGRSEEGKMIEAELASYGVRVVNLARDQRLPGTSVICISGEGKRTIISGQAAFTELSLEEADLSGFDFALYDCNQPDIALPLLERTNCEIVLDAGSYKEHTELFLKKASIVISSETFCDPKGQNVFQMQDFPWKYRAMTRGQASILTEFGEIPVPQVDCVDSLAAGDIFHGAFCFGYYEQELSFESALRFAGEIASESVKYRGPREWMKS